MALETAYYLVTEEVAKRSGVIESRHRAKDGRFILNDRDLSRIRFEVKEYINGIEGVEMITHEEAKQLIRDNNFAIGTIKPKDVSVEKEVVESPQEQEEEVVATENVETEAQNEGAQEEETLNEEETPSNEENNEQEVETKEEEE